MTFEEFKQTKQYTTIQETVSTFINRYGEGNYTVQVGFDDRGWADMYKGNLYGAILEFDAQLESNCDDDDLAMCIDLTVDTKTGQHSLLRVDENCSIVFDATND